MNLLLDTHIALWAVSDHVRLPAAAKALIAAQGQSISISVASLWEIAIKHAKGDRGGMPVSASEAERQFSRAGFSLVQINAAHALAVERLASIHADPFDRIIVAQAVSEPYRLVTSNRVVAEYSDAIILV